MLSREAGAGGAGVGGTEAGRRSHTKQPLHTYHPSDNREKLDFAVGLNRAAERWMQRAERVITLAVGVGLGGALTYLLGFGRRTQKAEAYQREPSTAEPERSSWRPVGEKPVLGSRHMLRRLRRRDQKIDSEGGVYYNSADAPDWCQSLFSDSSQRHAPAARPRRRGSNTLESEPPKPQLQPQPWSQPQPHPEHEPHCASASAEH
jgi:hypothetical protein